MKKILIFLCCLTLFLCITENASAINYSASTVLNAAGQSFTFTTDPALNSAGGGGIFTIEARGDYSYNWSNLENLSWNIDEIVSDSGWAPANADEYKIFGYNDIWWKKSVFINDTLLASILFDNEFTVNLLNTLEVNLFNKSSMVSWSLEYSPVPEPSAFLLMGLGIMGLAGFSLKIFRNNF